VPLDHTDFFVVVPYHNEAVGMPATLVALESQSDTDFSLVLVDNCSVDGSQCIAAKFAAQHCQPNIHLTSETRKGTGAAADTGFRFAIRRGAGYIARTDADCLPERHWVANIKRAFREHDLEFVVGKIKPRTDDISPTRADRVMIPLLILLAENYGRVHRRGRRFRYPYIMVAGNNLAITADLYERSGGFPRTSFEEVFEDLALGERVRTLTTRAQFRPDVVVFNSIRRVRRYGYLKTLLWYANHRYRPAVVDVR
jgi:glycosyltransferase involved in cell wall biosynthesis